MIFISYRRDDSAPAAQLVYRELSERFGKQQVFIDVERNEAGTPFLDRVLTEVRRSRAVVAVIGPAWQNPRLFEPRDPVRCEIATALQTRIPLIPTLLGDAAPPISDALPPDIQGIAGMGEVRITFAENHATDLARLVDQIARVSGMPVSATPDESRDGGIYKVDMKTWQWQGILSAGAQEAMTLAWQAMQNAVPAHRLATARQIGPLAYTCRLEEYTSFTFELVPQSAQTLVRATVRNELLYPDLTKMLLRKYQKPLERFVDSLKRSQRLT